MVFLDATVVNLALPALQTEFGAGVGAAQWVVEAYALTLASVLLLGGSLGDRYGRRRAYVFGTALFAGASVACGFSLNSGMLIAARAIQGIGGAFLVPGSLGLITSAYPDAERGRAIGTWSGLSAITTAIGPVVGGWFIEHFTWRWVFFLNIPMALAVLGLCLRISETKYDTSSGKLDWLGACLATVGLSGIVFAFIEFPISANKLMPAMAATIGFAALLLLAAIERRAENPMIPSALFRSREFSGANLLTFLVYAPLGALLFFAPLDLIQIQHYSVVRAGAAFSPFVIVMLLFSRSAGRLAEMYGPRLPLTVGSLVASTGYGIFALMPQDGHYWTTFFPGVLALSAGMALIVAPLTTTVMNSIPESHAGVASGINNAVSRLASLVAVAAFGALLVQVFSRTLDHQLLLTGVSAEETRHIHANRFQLAAIKSENPLALRAVSNSFVTAYRVVLWSAAVMVFPAAATGWILINPRTPRNRGLARMRSEE